MIRVGLIGTGNWGANLARVLNQSLKCEFAAMYDKDPSRLQHQSRLCRQAKVCTSFRELLDSVDAVVVATPIASHFEVVKEAIDSGKHVFVEKPLAVTSEQCAALTKMAERRGVVLMVGHTFIYTAAVQKIKAEIDSQNTGDLHYITLQRVNLGPYLENTEVTSDLAVHDISILLYWLGEMPVRASSFGRACVHKHNQDVAFLWFEFASGLIASIEVSWLSPQKLRRTCVVGSKMTIVYDDLETNDKVKIYHRNMEFREPETFGEFQMSYRMGDLQVPYLGNTEPLQTELEHFIHCAETGSKPWTDGEFGTNVVRCLEMAVANPVMKSQPIPSGQIL